MQKRDILMIAFLGLLTWTFNGCEGPEGPQGPSGIDGTDGTNGIDATDLPPAGTFFSIAANNNAGDMQFGSFVNYLAFDSVNTEVATNYPTAQQVVSHKTPLPPEIDGSEADGEWIGNGITIPLEQITDFEKYDGENPAGVTFINMKSMYDESYVYFQLSWNDADESDEKAKLTYSTNDGWSSSGNEDRFYFHWPITGFEGSEFADGDGCSAFCHYDESAANGKGYMFTEFPGQLVDIWQWKASRANPMGYIHDKHLIYHDPDAFDASADKPKSFSGRKGDQGRETYVENKIQDSGFPKYMHINDPNANAGYPSLVHEMVPFETSAVFSDGATIPGVFLQSPTGSNSDVLSKGVYSNGGWLVEVRRLRNTGNGDDHQFLPE